MEGNIETGDKNTCCEFESYDNNYIDVPKYMFIGMCQK